MILQERILITERATSSVFPLNVFVQPIVLFSNMMDKKFLVLMLREKISEMFYVFSTDELDVGLGKE